MATSEAVCVTAVGSHSLIAGKAGSLDLSTTPRETFVEVMAP